MKGSIAAGLAAGANFLAGRLQSEYEMEQKQKLYQMQQDAEMKRQMFLEKYRADLDEENAAKKHEREKDDVVGTFKDPETGTYFGRTKGGSSVELHATSDDYQSDLSKSRDLKNEKDTLSTEAQRARIERMRKEVENYDSLISKRNEPKPEKVAKEPKDPDDNYIRGAYNKGMHEEQYPVDPTTGKPATEPKKDFNRATADANVRNTLAEAYGQEKVDKILGKSVKDQVASGFDGPATRQSANADLAAQPPQKSPTDPNAPSAQQIMIEANQAIEKARQIAGGNAEKFNQLQAQIQARVAEYFKKYGYSQ